MTAFGKAPTTDELLWEASQAASIRHRVEFEGLALELLLQMDRILVYREGEQRPIATLRFGGPFSGAIWINEQLVAEYHKDRDGQFVVTDIAEGLKLPESRRRKDPVQHLLGQLQPA